MGDKKKKKDRKRHHSDSDDQEKVKKKRHHSPSSEDKKKKHKHKKQKKKHKKRKHSTSSGSESDVTGPKVVNMKAETAKKERVTTASVAGRSTRPMTKEELEKQQSVIRRVYDPDTGRTRLVKGDGEILEEIVSKERQREINKQATAGDGVSFQRAVGLMK